MSQTFLEQGAVVDIMKNSTGQRFARISHFGGMTRKGRYIIPLELCELAAGKDAWMREIQFCCADCRSKHPAKDMQNGYCPACVEKAEQENAIADGHANT